MSKIIRVDLKDALQLPTGFLAPAGFTCAIYLRVPDSWVEGNALAEERVEAVLENMYGATWREGNEDGSSYRVLSMTTTLFSEQDETERVWLQHDPSDRHFQYWYHHVSDDGQFQKQTPAEF